MASLTLRTPDGRTKIVNLVKRVTSIGRGSDNDIALEDPHVPENALHLLQEGDRYTVGSHGEPFVVNGKKKAEHVLDEHDTVEVGHTQLVFSHKAAAPPEVGDPADSLTADAPGIAGRELVSLRMLTAISERLFQSYDLNTLLDSLMDSAIEVTRADKGFLILMEDNEPRIKVARNISRENLTDALERLSDSIVAKVVKSQKPLIIRDALDDPSTR
jgi:pSer/pThr/pTyr-binding forkhead associated (FHA) protein